MSTRLKFFCELIDTFHARGSMDGDTTRTRSEFENELMKIRYNFLGIRHKNVKFVLCQFQRFELYYKKNILSFYFETDIERNLRLCLKF